MERLFARQEEAKQWRFEEYLVLASQVRFATAVAVVLFLFLALISFPFQGLLNPQYAALQDILSALSGPVK